METWIDEIGHVKIYEYLLSAQSSKKFSGRLNGRGKLSKELACIKVRYNSYYLETVESVPFYYNEGDAVTELAWVTESSFTLADEHVTNACWQKLIINSIDFKIIDEAPQDSGQGEAIVDTLNGLISKISVRPFIRKEIVKDFAFFATASRQYTLTIKPMCLLLDAISELKRFINFLGLRVSRTYTPFDILLHTNDGNVLHYMIPEDSAEDHSDLDMNESVETFLQTISAQYARWTAFCNLKTQTTTVYNDFATVRAIVLDTVSIPRSLVKLSEDNYRKHPAHTLFIQAFDYFELVLRAYFLTHNRKIGRTENSIAVLLKKFKNSADGNLILTTIESKGIVFSLNDIESAIKIRNRLHHVFTTKPLTKEDDKIYLNHLETHRIGNMLWAFSWCIFNMGILKMSPSTMTCNSYLFKKHPHFSEKYTRIL